MTLPHPIPPHTTTSPELDHAEATDVARILAGLPLPLGATPDDEGVNFALSAPNATQVTLCLFDEVDGAFKLIEEIDLPCRTDYVWHGKIPGLKTGQVYGYRVNGPFEPQHGFRFNRFKVLLDPYAREIARPLQWDPSLYGYPLTTGDDLQFNDLDSAHAAPLARVVDNHFDWGDTPRPTIPWEQSVIYEAHVKGLTMTHPDVPEDLRGTYLGMAHPAIVDHVKALGVTVLEVMPLQHFVQESFLLDKGLTNYWGYSPLAFFAPEPRYACPTSPLSCTDQVKTMIRAYHEAGIEVVMDVVYNHSGEGNHLGPTLSFRGVDNASYYRLGEIPRYYFDTTGCGNTFNMDSPVTLQLFMDSLRYWVTEMHLDGFRFDLAATLAREAGYVDPNSSFFKIIHQDPVLSRVKLIAEPWDIGGDGYQLGNFPAKWAEWNGRFRDVVRRYWKGDDGLRSDMATCLTGSNDLYGWLDERKLYGSVNFVTCHDGFTVADLVSYNGKHNEANLEDNRDGANDNHSWNCGVEGDTDDPAIIALRARQQRNLLATTLLALGVPMLLHGDELGRTQGGNNNTYCQDTPLSWITWDAPTPYHEHQDFVRSVLQFRLSHAAFCRSDHLLLPEESTWFRPDGSPMTPEDWAKPHEKSVALLLNPPPITVPVNALTNSLDQSAVLLFLNPYHEGVTYALSVHPCVTAWEVAVDTSLEIGVGCQFDSTDHLIVPPRSLVCLKQAAPVAVFHQV